jgi:hypothetical protein
VTGSNRRPPACKAGALPAELTARATAGYIRRRAWLCRARPPRPRIETRNRKRSSWPRSGRISFGDAPSGIRTRATTLKGWRPRPLVDGGGRAQNSREPCLHWPSGPVAQLVEQGTFNPKVAGSIPARPIRESPAKMHIKCPRLCLVVSGESTGGVRVVFKPGTRPPSWRPGACARRAPNGRRCRWSPSVRSDRGAGRAR